MARRGLNAVDRMLQLADEETIDGESLPRLIHQVRITTKDDPKAVSKAWTDHLKNLQEIAQYQHPKHRPVESNTHIDAKIEITIKQFGSVKEDKTIDIVTEKPKELPEPAKPADEDSTPVQLEAEEELSTADVGTLPG
jgi:hypothetical protein